jgi:excinuclease UvrABC nuclease subunit
MKKRFWILFLVCACLLMGACQNGKNKNTPEATTEAFLKAFYTADFTHMYQVTTKKSQVVIKQLQEGMKDRPEQLEAMRARKIEFVETKVVSQTDSTAVCASKFKVDGNNQQAEWELLKENDLWKVTMVLP